MHLNPKRERGVFVCFLAYASGCNGIAGPGVTKQNLNPSMTDHSQQSELRDASVEFYLLGRVALDDCLALQERLAGEAAERGNGQIDVLLCEHSSLITVGRAGSRGHIRLSGDELRRRQLDVRWISRGGGCVLHGPGQLAVYPLVPLEWHGWSVGEFLRRFQQAMLAAFEDMQIRGENESGGFGIWGRSGQLVTMGVAVRDWITRHGAFINVNPLMTNYGFVDVAATDSAMNGRKTTMGCLLAERRRPVTMPEVRAALVANLAAAFGCDRYHLHTGHPFLREIKPPSRAYAARAC